MDQLFVNPGSIATLGDNPKTCLLRTKKPRQIEFAVNHIACQGVLSVTANRDAIAQHGKCRCGKDNVLGPRGCPYQRGIAGEGGRIEHLDATGAIDVQDLVAILRQALDQ